jgi:hypothetical protein
MTENSNHKTNQKKGMMHQPYTTPPGYVPPTLGEQLQYFYKKHGHTYRYGYSLVIFTGIIALGCHTLLGKAEPPTPSSLETKNNTT